MGANHSTGEGRALAEERMRAEISVKLHLAVGGKMGHLPSLAAAVTFAQYSCTPLDHAGHQTDQ